MRLTGSLICTYGKTETRPTRFGQLFLFVKNTHCSIKDSRIIQCNDTSVRTLLKVNSYTGLCIKVLTAKIVAYAIYVDSEFICNAL